MACTGGLLVLGITLIINNNQQEKRRANESKKSIEELEFWLNTLKALNKIDSNNMNNDDDDNDENKVTSEEASVHSKTTAKYKNGNANIDTKEYTIIYADSEEDDDDEITRC